MKYAFIAVLFLAACSNDAKAPYSEAQYDSIATDNLLQQQEMVARHIAATTPKGDSLMTADQSKQLKDSLAWYKAFRDSIYKESNHYYGSN